MPELSDLRGTTMNVTANKYWLLAMVCLFVKLSNGQLPVLPAGAKKLDVLRGTWLITYPDTAKNGSIDQDSILTKLSWNAKGDILSGYQEIKANGHIKKTTIKFVFDSRTGKYSYAENSNKPSLVIIEGKRWIYPAGNYRTVNTFNKENTVIIYQVQQLNKKGWITIKTGERSQDQCKR